MRILNRLDRNILEELTRNDFTLSQVQAYNDPEYSVWASRRRRVANVLVWEFNWFLTSGNYLLRFPGNKTSYCPTEIVYLPDALVRRCYAKEECCVKHPFVLEIVPVLHFVREEQEFLRAKPQEVYISFDSVEELCGSIAFLAKISARNVRTAAITFGPPVHMDHRIHINAVCTKDDFGFDLLQPVMREWLMQQGITAAEVVGNETVALNCAKTLYQYQMQHGIKTNIPPISEGEKKTETEAHETKYQASRTLLLSNPDGNTLNTLVPEGDPESLFINWERLDRGSQGEVFRAVRKSDGSMVAIKRITVKREQKELPCLVREISLLKELHHPNIVTLYDCYRKGNQLYLVMELMDGGKLTDLVFPYKGDRVHFTEAQLATLMREVLQALQCLHSAGCIHRDIKSDNILLSSRGEVKLGDFGFAAMLSVPKGTRKTMVGTPYWMAPEVASGKPYNIKADVWSAGILFLELCDGQPPLMGLNPMRALLKISVGPPPVIKTAKHWSLLCREFASFLLVKDPAKRPTINRALRHPFIVKRAEPTCQFIVGMLGRRKAISSAHSDE